MTDVIVVGGGPVGLLLAAELKLAGADPLVLEAATGEERRTRSLGLRSINGRSAQTLALRGLVEPLAEAQWAMLDRLAADGDPGVADLVGHLVGLLRQGKALGHFSGLPLAGDGSAGVAHLLLKQHELERVLAERAAALGVRVRSGCEVVDVADEGERVVVTPAGGEAVHARYLVGCDGGRSVVRKRAGFAFTGTPATMTGRTAVARLADPGAVTSSHRGPGGLVNLSLVPGEIATIEFDGGPDERDAVMTAGELEASIRRVTGTDVAVAELGAGIRYSDNTRHADTYRKGRILLAGDAAHVHSPVGGQGLNLGLQDAANLGWKLGLVARGMAGEELLDTYTAERHPVAVRVLRNTRAQVALMRPGPQVDALREVLAETLEIPGARRHFADMVNGLDIDHAPGSPYPLTGRFLPEVGLKESGPARELLRDGRGLLLDLAGPGAVREAAAGYGDRVQVVTDAAGDAFGGAGAVLVRPDGYIAWAGDATDQGGLAGALAAWFGRAS